MSDANRNGRLQPAEVEALLRAELPTLKLDQGKIKLREWEALEEVADKPTIPWLGVSFPPMWFVRGELWLLLRREHPTLAYEDLADLDGDLLEAALGLASQDQEDAEEPDPTGGTDQAPTGKSELKPSPTSATSGG